MTHIVRVYVCLFVCLLKFIEFVKIYIMCLCVYCSDGTRVETVDWGGREEVVTREVVRLPG